MLRAIVQKKTRFHHRYLGHREEGEKNVRAEDEITSSFFDGLALLDAPDVLRFWRQLLGKEQRFSFFPDEEPSHLSWHFWPRRWSDESWIEPDMHLVFHWPCGESRTILVELKWRSRLPERQLQDQWMKYLSNERERSESVHVFIGRDVSAALAARDEAGVWGADQLILRPWIEIRGEMAMIETSSGPLRRWLAIADQFLANLQVSRFSGFQDPPQVDLATLSEARCFWAGPRFFDEPLSPSSFVGLVRSEAVPKEIFFSRGDPR